MEPCFNAYASMTMVKEKCKKDCGNNCKFVKPTSEEIVGLVFEDFSQNNFSYIIVDEEGNCIG